MVAWPQLTFTHLTHAPTHRSLTLTPISGDLPQAAASRIQNLLHPGGWEVVLAKGARLVLHLHQQGQDRVCLRVEDVTLVEKLALAAGQVSVVQVKVLRVPQRAGRAGVHFLHSVHCKTMQVCKDRSRELNQVKDG